MYASVVPRAIPEQRASERREQAQPRPHTPGARGSSRSRAVAALVVLVASPASGPASPEPSSDERRHPRPPRGHRTRRRRPGARTRARGGSISVSAVGALAGAAIVGPKAALPLAVATAAVEWSSRRTPLLRLLQHRRALVSRASPRRRCSASARASPTGELVIAAAGLVAGGVYFVVNTGLLSGAMALEGHDSWRRVWNERFSWLLPHYVAFGAVGGAIALSY